MKLSDIDALLMLFPSRQRKPTGAAEHLPDTLESNHDWATTFSASFMDPFSKTALTPYRN